MLYASAVPLTGRSSPVVASITCEPVSGAGMPENCAGTAVPEKPPGLPVPELITVPE